MLTDPKVVKCLQILKFKTLKNLKPQSLTFKDLFKMSPQFWRLLGCMWISFIF